MTPACQSAAPDRYPVIPRPAELTPRRGEFVLDLGTPLIPSDRTDAALQSAAVFGSELLGELLGGPLKVGPAPQPGGDPAITLTLDPVAYPGREEYALRVRREGISVAAGTPAGVFYGLQTLRQLAPPDDGFSPVTLPAVDIHDEPRFAYRGMHLDVGRHFFPVDFVKRYIDLLARYKMNTFHWHLTEDQGWRIEIKAYPRLTQVAAWRKETILQKHFDPYIGDGEPYGGYYTQDEIRDVVAYAAARHVTVIPEIEMPGHSLAALAAYPELGCTEGPFEVATTWGVHEDIFCPGETTFEFLEGVLTEVMELFPSQYIHIGGDEAPKTRWRNSALAQEVMRREGLADENALQSYFIKRIERFLASHGRRLIGWDEILEGGLAPEATVMSWRGMDGGIEAAQQGHDVIMTPTSHVYFDYYQMRPEMEPLAIGGFTPLEKVYQFEPVPPLLTADQARHVLGAQGNVWTEYMRTQEHVEYMVFPRMLALSEVVWSPRQRRDWRSFTTRLSWHLRRLSALGVNYRIPHVAGLEEDQLSLGGPVIVRLSTLDPAATIRYTTDGTIPEADAARYEAPLVVRPTEAGTVVSARAFLAGRASPTASARFIRSTLRPAVTRDSRELAAGLTYAIHEGRYRSAREVPRRTAGAATTGIIHDVALPPSAADTGFGLRLEGFVRVPRDGVYTFALTSDDGSLLEIDVVVVIDHDGLHGATERRGQVALAAGLHPIVIRYFQAGGGRSLVLHAWRDGEPVDLEGRYLHARN